MKRIGALFCLLCLILSANAQQYPSEWIQYSSDGYVYDIQSGNNNEGLSEVDFKNRLLNIARTNVAKQIQVKVQDVAQINKFSNNGQTSITYSAQTNFSTNLNLKLVGTKIHHDSVNNLWYAIAYIKRDVARDYYEKELLLVYNKIDNSIIVAKNFIESGFKSKAKLELEASLQLFKHIDEPFFWINVFGATQIELSEWSQRFNAKERTIKRMLAESRHSTTIYMACSADLFGTPYLTLQNEIKGLLSSEGCNFTDSPTNADWCITIKCNAREYSTVNIGGAKSYFSYVDAHIIVDKVITSQRIYEDEVSVKGGHTFGYYDAAKVGYREIKTKIAPMLQKYIRQ